METKMKKEISVLKLAAVLLLTTTAACESVPEEIERPAPVPSPKFPYMQMAPFGPPEPPYEYKVAPGDPMKEIWRPGFWQFDGSNYYWVPGELVLRPSPAAVWSTDRWELRSYGWVYVPGYWQ
jgi:hypothetical protein